MKIPSIPKKYRDLLSRAAWTAAQGAASVVTVDALGLPLWMSVPLGAALSGLKSWIATHVGDKNTVTFMGGEAEPSPLAAFPETRKR